MNVTWQKGELEALSFWIGFVPFVCPSHYMTKLEGKFIQIGLKAT